MNRYNPDEITRADLIVGIPTCSPAEALQFVVEQISRGLKEFFPDFISVIINIDSPFSEATRANFLKVSDIPKIYIPTSREMAGRGRSLYSLLQEMLRLNANTAVVIDPTSSSITPEWIRDLATPIFCGYDFATPLYSRLDGDDSLSSNICYPLICGLLGKSIRHPMSGDFAFSSAIAQYYLTQPWNDAIYKNGVDIFMTLHALLGKFECCEVALGPKLKKASPENFTHGIRDVVEVLFEALLANKDNWLEPVDLKQLRLFGEIRNEITKSKLECRGIESLALREFNAAREVLGTSLDPGLFAGLCEMFDRRDLTVDSQMWTQILYQLLYVYDTTDFRGELIKGLESLYIGRLLTLSKELEKDDMLERLIERQAERFHKLRNLLTQKYEYKLAVA